MKYQGITWFQRFGFGYFEFLDHFIGRKNVYRLFSDSREKLARNVLESLSKKEKGNIIPVDRHRDLSLKDLKKRYIEPGIPVVLTGAAKSWGCCQKWSLDYFRDLHGDDKIVMVDQNKIENPYNSLTLREVIESIGTDREKYYRFYPLLVRHPEHIHDLDHHWLRANRHKLSFAEAFQVFIGGAGSETPIHSASAANLFVQAYGEKKWVIYSPFYNPVIEPQPVRNLYRSAPYRSGVPFNPFDPDYATYPMYRYIDGYEVHLRPGDILFNPPYHWHSVRNLTDSVGVGYRWIAPLHCFKIDPLYSCLDIFATNPPIWKSIQLFKNDFNLVQLAETGQLREYLDAKAEQENAGAI